MRLAYSTSVKLEKLCLTICSANRRILRNPDKMNHFKAFDTPMALVSIGA